MTDRFRRRSSGFVLLPLVAVTVTIALCALAIAELVRGDAGLLAIEAIVLRENAEARMKLGTLLREAARRPPSGGVNVHLLRPAPAQPGLVIHTAPIAHPAPDWGRLGIELPNLAGCSPQEDPPCTTALRVLQTPGVFVPGSLRLSEPLQIEGGRLVVAGDLQSSGISLIPPNKPRGSVAEIIAGGWIAVDGNIVASNPSGPLALFIYSARGGVQVTGAAPTTCSSTTRITYYGERGVTLGAQRYPPRTLVGCTPPTLDGRVWPRLKVIGEVGRRYSAD